MTAEADAPATVPEPNASGPVLVTGFAPFAGASVNSSMRAVRMLATRWREDPELVTAELPVVFGESADVLRDLIAAHRPRLVLAAGLAEGRPRVSIERIGINIDDARIPDNAGAQPVDEPIEPDGPAARFSGLPIKAAFAAVEAAGVPVEVSQTAGTFVCNHVLYKLMGELEQHPGTRGGFVHVPLAEEDATPEQRDAGVPTLPLAQLVAALQAVVRVSLAGREIRLGAGAIS